MGQTKVGESEMKVRLVKYANDGWIWEVYSQNGHTICESTHMFNSKRLASKSLKTFLKRLRLIPVVNYIIWNKKFQVLDCSK